MSSIIDFTRALSYSTFDFLKYSYQIIMNRSFGNYIPRLFQTGKIDQLKQICYYFQSPTKITDNIYLGSAFNSYSYSMLKSLNIKYIINVSKEVNMPYPKEFEYYRYSLNDDGKSHIDQDIDTLYNLILDLERHNDGNILIHCLMGASRSAVLIAYYLMRKNGMSATDAIQYLKDKRNIVNPSKCLYEDLIVKENKN